MQKRTLDDLLSAAAIVSKLCAIGFWLFQAWFLLDLDLLNLHAANPPREAPPDWGTPAYVHRIYFQIGEAAVMTILALLPNGVLTSPRPVFALLLALALVPLRVLFTMQWSAEIGGVATSLFGLAIIIGTFGALPLCMILSFLRRIRGERVRYV